MQINPKSLGLALGIIAGAWWFLIMTVSLLTGIADMTITMVGGFHPFFSYSWGGMVIIVIEHLVGGFVFGWIFGWLYNKMLNR
ncbi:MAG: hypothetical protein AAB496_01635 [Patescibacteria group bacterium]